MAVSYVITAAAYGYIKINWTTSGEQTRMILPGKNLAMLHPDHGISGRLIGEDGEPKTDWMPGEITPDSLARFTFASDDLRARVRGVEATSFTSQSI